MILSLITFDPFQNHVLWLEGYDKVGSHEFGRRFGA